MSLPGGIGMVDQISMDSPLTGSQGKTVAGTTADPALLLPVVRGGLLSSPVETEAVLSSKVHRIAPTGNQAIALQEAARVELTERIARSRERAETMRGESTVDEPKTHATVKPARLPLAMMRGRALPNGMLVDKLVVVKPGDEGYEQDYTYASIMLREYGEPMPYATRVTARAKKSARARPR